MCAVIAVKLGKYDELMCYQSNCAADNPYNYLISLSSSGVPINVGTLLSFCAEHTNENLLHPLAARVALG